jgi:hypothetical protein
MLADIQSQIKKVDCKVVYTRNHKERGELKRRKRFLNHVLKAPCSEIDQKAINFIYGR